MKTLVLLFTSIFSFYILNAQSSDLAQLNTEDLQLSLEEVSIENNLLVHKKNNAGYLEKVIFKQPSSEVKKLENDIANFKLKEHPIFDDSEKAIYHIVFNKENAKAVVIYNNNGEVLSSTETFKNIRIPQEIRIKILTENPNYTLKSSQLTILYKQGKPIKRKYNVKIFNGTRTKTLKFKV